MIWNLRISTIETATFRSPTLVETKRWSPRDVMRVTLLRRFWNCGGKDLLRSSKRYLSPAEIILLASPIPKHGYKYNISFAIPLFSNILPWKTKLMYLIFLQSKAEIDWKLKILRKGELRSTLIKRLLFMGYDSPAEWLSNKTENVEEICLCLLMQHRRNKLENYERMVLHWNLKHRRQWKLPRPNHERLLVEDPYLELSSHNQQIHHY